MLKEQIIEKIRHNGKLKAKLQIVLDKSAVTIQRYLDRNDIMLTTTIAVDTIKEGLNIPKEDTIVELATAKVW